MTVVCDATSLIFLAKLSDFHFLKLLYQKICIPQEVYDEVVTKGKGKPGEKKLKEAGSDWIKIRTVSNQSKVKELQDTYGLGQGEAATIILAQELKANFIFTDDGPARKFASSFFQGTLTTVSGTIGILKFAKERGLISKTQLKSKIEFLKKEGFYLKEDLFKQILKEIEKN